MKRLSYIIILLIYLVAITSCQDKQNIVVTGKIIDERTGEPIPNAEVVVLCWYMNNIDDASFIKQNLTADKSGNYKVNFEKGHQIDVASKANGYQPSRSYNKLDNSKIKVNLQLIKQRSNSSIKALLTTGDVRSDTEAEPTFLKVRVYADQDGKELDFSKVITYGFDFKTQTINSDTLKTDFWFRTINKEEPPSTIAVAQQGGIIPVFDKEVKSSLLFEKAIAPTTGYKLTYQLTGEEAGFFILCRDGKTYGKIILEQSSIDKSIPDGKGSYYKEFGKNFSSLYQPNGTTDLSYSMTDINLENFLVGYRYK